MHRMDVNRPKKALQTRFATGELWLYEAAVQKYTKYISGSKHSVTATLASQASLAGSSCFCYIWGCVAV